MRARQLLAAALLFFIAVPLRAEEAPVTRDEALAFLRSVEKAYAREDIGTLRELTANEVLAGQLDMKVGRLFKDRNYFELSSRLLEFEPRPDGSVEIEFIEVMRSRPATGRNDQREKARRRLRLARREGEIVVIDAFQGDQPLLPDVGHWSPEVWTVEVELVPRPRAAFGSEEGEVRVAAKLRLRNLSPEATDAVAFGLHPFVRDLSLEVVGWPAVSAERHEGTADAWRLTLPEPIAAGAAIELELEYAYDELGTSANSRVGPEGAHLFAEGAWLPLFSPTLVPGADRASHDVTIVVPEDWSAVAPGEFVSDEPRPGGRRAWRWRSQFPGEALVLVAGRLERQELRLSDSLTLESWTQAGAGPIPPALLEAMRSMTAHFERLFGPPPTSRISLVRSLAPGLRTQPAFLVVDQRDVMGAELHERRREKQPLFYIAHQLTHLWLQDGVRPVGGPAQILTEGLCDSVTFDWMDHEVSDTVSLWHRGRILHLTRGKPSADRPILVTHPGAPDHDVFGAGKTLVVLDGYRSFVGRERWAEVLREYVQSQRGKQVGVGEILAALGVGDGRLEAYISSWIIGEGLADIAVHEPVSREIVDPETGLTVYEVKLTVENLGLGPVPVRLRTMEDELGAPWRTEQLELGTEESTVLTYRLANPLRFVEVDERMVTWQSAVENDSYPVRKVKPKSFKGQHRKVTEEDQARLEQLLKGG